MTFVDRDKGNATLCGPVNVGLVNPADAEAGTATCHATVDIGSATAASFTVGIVVSYYYMRDSSADDAIVEVARALASNFVAGGGYLVLTDSAGQKAADAGSRNNFGFAVKFNPGGRNLQGHVNTIVRRTEDGKLHVYQIKASLLTSPAVTGNRATFNGKASIIDITDPKNPVSVDGKRGLQITMTDNGEPGSTDTIAITIWNKNGGLWYASNWDGSGTVEQPLGGGNLLVC